MGWFCLFHKHVVFFMAISSEKADIAAEALVTDTCEPTWAYKPSDCMAINP